MRPDVWKWIRLMASAAALALACRRPSPPSPVAGARGATVHEAEERPSDPGAAIALAHANGPVQPACDALNTIGEQPNAVTPLVRLMGSRLSRSVHLCALKALATAFPAATRQDLEVGGARPLLGDA